MTKEELLHGLLETGSRTKIDIMVKRFFESNVCIPKGDNVVVQYNFLNTGWKDINMLDVEIRIKPSDPIYEYKWSVNEILIYTVTDKFYTDEEISKVIGFTFTKLIDTKQERK